jgi:hypothetical protein
VTWLYDDFIGNDGLAIGGNDVAGAGVADGIGSCVATPQAVAVSAGPAAGGDFNSSVAASLSSTSKSLSWDQLRTMRLAHKK